MKQMSAQKKLLLGAVLIVLGMLFLGSSKFVAAQQQASVTSRQSLESEIAIVERTYRGQLEEYRQLEQKFVVARQEYKQLNTLSSLESAVQSTKQVMSMRDQVLGTYFRLLELRLLNSEGIDLELKQAGLVSVRDIQTQLLAHKEATQLSNERDEIADRAEEFDEISKVLVGQSDFARSLLKLGQLQLSYDKTLSLLDKVATDTQTDINTLDQAERERALKQIEIKIRDIETELTSATESVEKKQSQTSVSRSVPEFQRVYVGLNQVLTFIEEVISYQE